MVYLQLFVSFFKIGLFAFGGGYAIIAMIQHEITVRGWMTPAEFTDVIAISQSTPGPIGINSATWVGYTASGSIWGSVVATFAIMLPSFIIMIILTRFYLVMIHNKYIEYAMTGLRPAVIGLIASAALMLMNNETFIDYKSFIIFGLAFAASMKFKIHPILIILASGLAGVLLY